MKAIVQDRYGSPDALRLDDVEEPAAGPGEVVVWVHAASVNAYDWHVMRGDPYAARLLSPAVFGRTGPRNPVRGRDFAGTVVRVGADVTRWRAGDEVFGDLGDANGAFAEAVRVAQDAVEAKPSALTFAQAAALPLAGMTALAGLRDLGGVGPGKQVLVNGASGGVGTFAVQIAKASGATTTAVCSTRNADLARSLGADHVVDYTREDFTATGRRYDVVLDLVGNRSLADLRRALTPTGTLVLSGGGVSSGGNVFGPLGLIFRAQAAAPFTRQRLLVLRSPSNKGHLAALKALADAGDLAPVIDRVYPLAEVPDAIRYVEDEHARAKVVISVAG